MHDAGFETLLCVLAACHFVAGAVMLRVRPSSRPGAVFVWAIGAALAAGAGAVILGGLRSPRSGASRRSRCSGSTCSYADKQAGVTAALLGALTFGYSISLAPPVALAHSLSDLATGALALVAVVVMLGGAAFLLRRMRDVAIGFAVATWVALFYLVGVFIVGLAGSATGPVDQAAQLLVTGAWAALATAGCLAAIALPLRFRAGVRTVAELSLWTVAVKALWWTAWGSGCTSRACSGCWRGSRRWRRCSPSPRSACARPRSRCHWPRRSPPCSSSPGSPSPVSTPTAPARRI